MNNALYELLVPRLTQTRDRMIQALVIVAIVAIAASSVIFGPLTLVIAIILGVASYLFIFPKFHIEYEYTLLNHDLDIDVIYKQAKRKSVIAFDLKKAEIIAPANSHRLDSYKNFKVIDCSSGDPKSKPYAIMIPMNQTMNRVLIQPDEEMIQSMRNFLGRTFYQD